MSHLYNVLDKFYYILDWGPTQIDNDKLKIAVEAVMKELRLELQKY